MRMCPAAMSDGQIRIFVGPCLPYLSCSPSVAKCDEHRGRAGQIQVCVVTAGCVRWIYYESISDLFVLSVYLFITQQFVEMNFGKVLFWYIGHTLAYGKEYFNKQMRNSAYKTLVGKCNETSPVGDSKVLTFKYCKFIFIHCIATRTIIELDLSARLNDEQPNSWRW